MSFCVFDPIDMIVNVHNQTLLLMIGSITFTTIGIFLVTMLIDMGIISFSILLIDDCYDCVFD